MATPGAIADAGCDYLRLTFQPGNAGFSESLSLWQESIQTEADAGHTPRTTTLQGYHGLLCGGYFTGQREDGLMCQVSGAASNNVIARLRGVEMECNVPRCDVQVTPNGDRTYVPTAAEIKDRLREAERASQRGITRKTALYEAKDHADTLYIGARASGSFLRVYNATAVHPQSYPPNCWRFEVEAHKREAPTIFASLRRCESVTHCAASHVIGHCMSLGLAFDWFGDEVPIMPAKQYRKTDAERRLNWMESHVRKTFWWLINNGYSRELERRLHLPPGTLPDGDQDGEDPEEVKDS